MDYSDVISEKESLSEALEERYLYLPGMEPDNSRSHFMEASIQTRWQDELGNNVTNNGDVTSILLSLATKLAGSSS